MAQWLTGIQMMKPHPLPGVLWPEKLGRFWSVFWGPANSAIWRVRVHLQKAQASVGKIWRGAFAKSFAYDVQVAIYEPIVQGCWVASPASELRKGSKARQVRCNASM